MTKRRRSKKIPRMPKRGKKAAAQNGNGAAGTAPAAVAQEPQLAKVSITETQKLAAELMTCRSALQRKNVLIASLYDEINALRKDVLQAGVNAEARENQITAEKYGLPTQFHQLGQDGAGGYFVMCAPELVPEGKAGKVVKLPEPDAKIPTPTEPQLEAEDEDDDESDEDDALPELADEAPQATPEPAGAKA